MARRDPWPRDDYEDAVWASELKPLQRLVALCYADHADDGDVAWVSYDRLQQRTGIPRSTAARTLRQLVEMGWLVLVEPARQHYSARYRIAVPPQLRSGGEPVDKQSSSPGARPLADPAVPERDPAVPERDPAVPERDPTSLPDFSTTPLGPAVAGWPAAPPASSPPARPPVSVDAIVAEVRTLRPEWRDGSVMACIVAPARCLLAWLVACLTDRPISALADRPRCRHAVIDRRHRPCGGVVG